MSKPPIRQNKTGNRLRLRILLNEDAFWALRYVAEDGYGGLSMSNMASRVITQFLKVEAFKRGMLLDDFLKFAKEKSLLVHRPWNFDL